MALDARAKVLYHQIHPAKVLTDCATAALSCVLFWNHHLVEGLLIGPVPPVLATWALLSWADLERYRTSELGVYIGGYRTRMMEGLRLVGIGVVWVASWYRLPGMMAVGVLIIGGAWSRGVISRR